MSADRQCRARNARAQQRLHLCSDLAGPLAYDSTPCHTHFLVQVPQDFFHCISSAPLVLFRQAHISTKKDGLPVSCFHCRDDEMQVNCREVAHLDIWTPHCLHIDIQGPCVFPVVTAPRLPAAAFSGTIAMQDSTRPGFWSVPHCGSPEVERAEVKN